MGDGYISFYEGGYSSLSPENGNYIGFRMNAGQISSTTSVQSANQLSEVISRIKEGVQNVELQPLAEGVFDSVPKQQFQEIHALMKLTGVKPSVHAPIIDPAGFGERGYGGEYAREDAERRLFSVIEKAHELDPKGNIPVVIHSTGAVPGPEYRPGDTKKGEDRFKIYQDIIVNQETGEIKALKEDRLFYPMGGREDFTPLDPNKPLEKQGRIFTTKEKLDSTNQNDWDNRLREALMLKKESEEAISFAANKGDLYNYAHGTITDSKKAEQTEKFLSRAEVFTRDANLTLKSMFSKAYEFGDKEQKKVLTKMAEEWNKEFKQLGLDKRSSTQRDEYLKTIKFNQLLDQEIKQLESLSPVVMPNTWVRAEDFAMEKAAKTFGNLAFKGYSTWKDNAPIIAIENLYQGMAFSKAEDMEKLVKKARESFVEEAQKKGLSQSEAKEKASKLIGVTWDTGHLNMMKKHGFTDEDVKKETGKISKLVKHVHLTDNFGYGDSHLAPGMGNVPMKDILKELEKNGEFDKMRKVIEAGALTNPNMGLKMSPFKATLGAFGSPIQRGENPVYWNQAENIQGNYFAFPLAYMPEKHFSIYGSGFSTLPEELGGQIPGTGSRFSGTPNA